MVKLQIMYCNDNHIIVFYIMNFHIFKVPMPVGVFVNKITHFPKFRHFKLMLCCFCNDFVDLTDFILQLKMQAQNSVWQKITLSFVIRENNIIF